MLPKKNRVGKKAIEKIFKEGKVINSSVLTFRFILEESASSQISFIVPKTISKKAVERNLLRRRGYRALAKYLTFFPSELLGVFIFKKYQDDVSILENEIKNIVDKVR